MDGDLQRLYTKLDAIRGQCKEVHSKVVYTQANVFNLERVNELKGTLAELEKRNDELTSEVTGLRRVKNDQLKEIDQINGSNHYPEQLKQLFAELNDLRGEQRARQANLLHLRGQKRANTEEIAKCEEELRGLKQIQATILARQQARTHTGQDDGPVLVESEKERFKEEKRARLAQLRQQTEELE